MILSVSRGLILFSFTFLAAAAMPPKLPVLTPDSSWKVESSVPGSIVHTRVKILETAAATPANESQINSPDMVRGAYQLPSSGGTGAIAIVDAYHFPTALHDFNAFSEEYGLPTESSKKQTESSNTKFQIVFANGRKPAHGGSYIASWNLEEALDIEWAHAIAPEAKIYLVEAASASMNDLLYAVQVASNLPNVHQVSMSWGGGETYNEASNDWVFTTSYVTYFAAGGDTAADVEYPSVSPNVMSIGGTSLNRDGSGNLLSETGWSDTGCGVSLYEHLPSYQSALAGLVGNRRASNDVSFLADPNTGVFVYDSTSLYGQKGWWVVGGTSLATPCWAGVANLASATNGTALGSQAEGTRLYQNLGNAAVFRDVTSGAAAAINCVSGWDQVTGIGSPLGLQGK